MSHPSLAAWHTLVAAQDPSGLPTLLADDVVLLSPMLHTPQVGREQAVKYLSAVFRVFAGNGFSYVRELSGPREAVLEFEVTLEDVLVNGVDMVRFDEAGRITELKVMVRPLQALKLLHRKLAAVLAEPPA